MALRVVDVADRLDDGARGQRLALAGETSLARRRSRPSSGIASLALVRRPLPFVPESYEYEIVWSVVEPIRNAAEAIRPSESYVCVAIELRELTPESRFPAESYALVMSARVGTRQ